jgi:hypothetical protein
MKFVAVHWASLMTRHEYCVERPFPYYVTSVGWELSPPTPQVEAPGWLFKLAFWRLTLSILKCCHMDLWLARLVLTHHHLHRLHQLPSAKLTGDRVSSSFLIVVFFCPCLVKLRAVVQLSLFEQIFRESSPRPPIWPSWLLSHWSSSQTVPLTLVLRLLASAELWLYWTNLPPNHLENHLIIVDSIKMIPLGLKQDVLEHIVGTHNLPATLVTLSL